MMITDLILQKPLEDYVSLFEKATSRSMGLFSEVIDPEFIFEDPYHKIQGCDEFSKLMRGRFRLYEGSVRDKSSLHYRIHDFFWGKREGVAYMYWSMIYPARRFLVGNGKNAKDLTSFDGMSELCLSQNGKVLSQRDFWGKHESFNVKGYKALKM
ncbi:MAG: hypothetical protein KAJ40_03180 [Alphaproteobacteria bacterium]|nr:hypothetical protein [Alphaproteobacteria bacterium]